MWPRRVTERQSAKDRAEAVTLSDMKYNRRRLDVVAHSQTQMGHAEAGGQELKANLC